MKRTVIVVACVAIGAAVLLAGALTVGQLKHPASRVYTDGASIRQPAESARVREILWQPPITLPQTVNTDIDEYEGRLSADGQTFCFVRGKAGGHADIFISSRISPDGEDWGEPTPLTAINTGADELGPELSRDGQLLFFYSNRPGGLGGYDVWIARRDGNGWLPPVNLGPAVNSEFNEYSPALSPDGSRLYFASNRPQAGDAPERAASGWPATLREDQHRRDYDLYVADMANGEAQSAAALNDLNTPNNEGAPAVSPAGDFLYFCSDRSGGNGAFDIYRARILRGELQPPAILGPEINTTANELDPSPSMGGFALHFSSDRAFAGAGVDPEQRYNLFYSESREVFIETASDEGPFDWAALIDLILPSVLWLLLALLSLLALLALLKGVKSRRMSLLARCLLASAAAHLLVLMLLTFWQVTTALREAFEKSGTQVALTSSVPADELASQIRGNLTEVAVQTTRIESERIETQLAQAERANEPESARVPLETAALPAHEPLQLANNQMEALPAVMMHRIVAPPMETADAPPVEVAMPTDVAQSNAAEAAAENHPAIAEVTPVLKAEVGDVDRASQPMPNVRIIPAAAKVESIDPPVAIALAAAPVDSRPHAPKPALVTAELAAHIPPNPPAIDAPLPLESPSTSVNEPRSSSSQPLTIESAAKTETTVEASKTQPAVPTVQMTPDKPRHSESVATVSFHDEVRESAAAAASAPRPHFAPPTLPGLAMVSADLPALEESQQRAAAQSDRTESAMPLLAPNPALGMSQRRDSDASTGKSHEFVRLSPEAGTRPDPSSAVVAPAPGAISESSIAPPQSKPQLAKTDFAPPPIDLAAIDVALPAAVGPPTETFTQRQPENRQELVERMGGSEATERAVALALQWLAAHQSADGRWAAKKFDEDCGDCRGAAKFDTDIAATGLALLCFFGADHTHVKDGPYRDAVARGVKWLVSQQKENGDLRGAETMYSHGIAAIAISEAFGMTRDERLAVPVQKATDFIVSAANQKNGGWRYEPGQTGDTSVLGWQVMALVSAQRAGFNVPRNVLQTSRDWLNLVSDDDEAGLYAYQPGHRHSPSMTAEGMFAQQLLGSAPQQPRMQASAQYLLKHLPRWRGDASTYYWYYATLAMYQHQGAEWKQWNEALTEQLLGHQRTDGAAAGSWDPVDNWSKIGGRIYQTALCTLCLEVYYRYLPMYAANEMARTSE